MSGAAFSMDFGCSIECPSIRCSCMSKSIDFRSQFTLSDIFLYFYFIILGEVKFH